MDEIDKILEQMPLKEKIALCSGKNFWQTKDFAKYGIPSLFMCDGPHGLRKQENEGDMLGVHQSRKATCFPAEVTTAGSWDPELTQAIGKAVAEEAADQGVGLVLGPGANLKRNPLCGRSFEYFSEDPHLAGKMAAGFIRGAEGESIGTSLKHFAANSQERERFTSDSILDERTLRELYLAGFEIAVKEGKPSTVMCAYPKLNGTHCSDNESLLMGILRKEWGFDGMVVTDWGAMNDRIAGFRAGCDLNMPGGSEYMEKEVFRAVQTGNLPERAVDDAARRILRLVFRTAKTLRTHGDCDYEAHHALARQAAEAGAVLLKNEGSILPLQENANIAVFGAMAKNMRFQGAGSSHINPTAVSQPLDFLPGAVYVQGCDDRGNTTEALLEEAAAAAKKAQTAIAFAGLPERFESEGFDREDMKLPEGHNRLIEAVAKANPNTVVILLCGSAVECPWADAVKAILYMGLPGQAGGEAIANLLYGRATPGGCLAESWPYRYEDVPSSQIYGKQKDALYEEGIYVGYRYYEKAGVPVRWPFGFGLSYTSFAYSKLEWHQGSTTVTVKNTGKVSGSKVVQLYVAAPRQGLHRPLRELRGFQKVFLQPGEEKTLSFPLTDRSFALWDDGWKVPGGHYTLCVGALTEEINIPGSAIPAPQWQKGSFYDTCAGKPDRHQWEAMLGRAYVPAVLQRGHFTMDNTVVEMKDYSLMMKIMFRATEKVIAKDYGGKPDYENPEFRMVMASSVGGPLRSMQISGGIKGGLIPGMLEIANGHFWRGVLRMLRD